MSRLSQLKQRRFVQIVVSYLAAAWISLEVLALFVERGQVPELVWEIALMWAIGGFGAALLVGWYHGERGKQKAPLSEILALGVIGAAVMVLSTSYTVTSLATAAARETARDRALSTTRVAVLYFEDASRDGSVRHVADGLTEGLIDELAAVRELDVISRSGVAPFRDRAVDWDSVVSRLEPGTIVTGFVEPLGSDLEVGIRLVDQSGTVFQRSSFMVAATELADAQQRVVAETARLLREWLGQELRVRRTRAATRSSEAWALYHRGEKARKDAEAAAAARDRPAMVTAFNGADSLLALSAGADPEWLEPRVLRAFVAYQRARMAASPAELEHWVAAGLDRLAPVLEKDPNHARAIEVRGTLKYWRRINMPPADPAEAQAVFDDARRDLERAVELDPSLASAHASLAHVYFNVPSITDALISGQRALEEDAFLENAHLVLKRNTDATYSLEQFAQSRRWCEMGQERFPDYYYFALCELLLMTTPAYDPDPDRARELLDRVDSLAPAHLAPWEGLRARAVFGGVLARAGMPEAARAVWDAARDRWSPEIDPRYEIPFTEAYMRTLAGDPDEAIDLLKTMAAAFPGMTFDTNWWWRELRSNPRWNELARGRAASNASHP